MTNVDAYTKEYAPIAQATINYDPQSLLTEVTGTYYPVDRSGNVGKEPVPFRVKARLTPKMEDRLLESGRRLNRLERPYAAEYFAAIIASHPCGCNLSRVFVGV